MRKILFMTLLLVSIYSSAFAVNWVWIDSSDTTTLDIDADSITRVDGIYSAWIRLKHVEYAQETVNGKKVFATFEHFNFRRNSTGDEVRSLQIIDYDENGNVIQNTKMNESWNSIIPGSLGERISKKILELRSEADKQDDTAAAEKAKAEEQNRKKEERSKRNKEIAKSATGVAGVLGGLFK